MGENDFAIVVDFAERQKSLIDVQWGCIRSVVTFII